MQQVSSARQTSTNVVSVLSVAARYPSGNAGALQTGDAHFWDAMSQGTDLVSRVPLQRWDADTFYTPDLASKKM